METRQITNTIQNRYDTYNMILRPETISLRNQFRDDINHQINSGNDNLPSYPATIIDGERINFIDRSTITQLNSSLVSEQRTEVMQNINNFTNSDENRMLLVENSSEEVKKYLKDLLIRASNYENISNEQLYIIGNTVLYTIGNIPEVTLVREVIEPLRSTMMEYDRNQIMEFILQISPELHKQIEEINVTEECVLEENRNEANSRIDYRILQNRRRIFMVGGSLLSAIALGYTGIPYLIPFVGPTLNVLTRSVPSINTTALIPSSSGGFEDDVLTWKEILQELSKKAREFLSGCL